MKIVQKKYISVVILWQPQILKQNQETAAGPQSPFVQNDLFFNFSWATSAEAYMTHFKFNRCTINLCLRTSTNAFDIASSVHNAAITYHEKRQGKKE